MWVGAPYADIPDAGPIRAEQVRLSELRLVALERRIDADLGLGRHRELIGELEALMIEHPYRERFVAQLMVAQYRSGRAGSAGSSGWSAVMRTDRRCAWRLTGESGARR